MYHGKDSSNKELANSSVSKIEKKWRRSYKVRNGEAIGVNWI